MIPQEEKLIAVFVIIVNGMDKGIIMNYLSDDLEFYPSETEISKFMKEIEKSPEWIPFHSTVEKRYKFETVVH